MNIVIVGHVDHGKSTVIGRLLADTGSLPEGKLEQVRELCRRTSKPFEYAFLLDALKDERSQGITIDTARCFFKTDKRRYIIIDAPGHVEFLKNMITGASRAEAALLVIDAKEGVRENSRRHGYMLSMLGIRQVVVLINKMDLVNWDRAAFESIKAEYGAFLKTISVEPRSYVPVSAVLGDNIASKSDNMPWYSGMTVLETLDSFDEAGEDGSLPFRMPVQDVYKFTSSGDSRRIVAGSVESGTLRVGDTVVFYPSGKRSTVVTTERWNAPEKGFIESGEAAGFTLDRQIYVKRGELAAKDGELPPEVGTRFRASLFHLGREPLTTLKTYTLKAGTAAVPARIERIVRVLDAAELDHAMDKQTVDRYEIAECIISCGAPIAFDTPERGALTTGRFVMVDNYEICTGGIITEALSDDLSSQRGLVMRRNQNWVYSEISAEDRAASYGHKAAAVIITGNRGTGKKELARLVERGLFDAGAHAYFLGMANLLYGVAAEIKAAGEIPERGEHIRRLGEVAKLFTDAGLILVISATELEDEEFRSISLALDGARVCTVWLGDSITTDLQPELVISAGTDKKAAAETIIGHLKESGVMA
ncbi:MAG: GTP-binding protein [Firmicutes bacterium]|nr:GTP-binding protein [Bacillota bacterium]